MNARPRYETPEDLKREQEIAERMGVYFKCEVKKLPLAYKLDWMAMRDEVPCAWIEAKRRFRTLDQYPDTFLSLQKLMAARELHAVSDLRCLFVVQFNDCLAYADILTPPHRKIAFKGRTDRDDWQDQEPVVCIPTAQWKVLEKNEDKTS